VSDPIEPGRSSDPTDRSYGDQRTGPIGDAAEAVSGGPASEGAAAEGAAREAAREGETGGADLPPPPTRRSRRGGGDELGERPEGSQRRVGQSSSLMRELPILVFVALALALLIKTFLVQAFFIPSDSMENTLLQGDRVLVNKFAPHFGDVKRGEVVVFRDPGGWLPPGTDQGGGNPVAKGFKDIFVFVGLLPSSSEKDLIKRVIGVPGDKVACCTDGKVTVNGIPLDEPYIYPGDKPSDRQFSVTVPPNRLWVMGDHRSLSADSRVHMADPGNGTIPADNVVGRAFVLVWPLDRWSTLGVPDTFKRKSLDDAAVTTSSVGLFLLVPLAVVRRRRPTRLMDDHVDA
jgi:signal peptidase I